MERTYNAHLAYIEYLKDEITEQLPELDITEVENRLKQYCDGLNKLDEYKNSYVEECLRSDLERNQTLAWGSEQKRVLNTRKK